MNEQIKKLTNKFNEGLKPAKTIDEIEDKIIDMLNQMLVSQNNGDYHCVHKFHYEQFARLIMDQMKKLFEDKKNVHFEVAHSEITGEFLGIVSSWEWG